jgi:hypothetical protein
VDFPRKAAANLHAGQLACNWFVSAGDAAILL